MTFSIILHLQFLCKIPLEFNYSFYKIFLK